MSYTPGGTGANLMVPLRGFGTPGGTGANPMVPHRGLWVLLCPGWSRANNTTPWFMDIVMPRVFTRQ